MTTSDVIDGPGWERNLRALCEARGFHKHHPGEGFCEDCGAPDQARPIPPGGA